MRVEISTIRELSGEWRYVIDAVYSEDYHECKISWESYDTQEEAEACAKLSLYIAAYAGDYKLCRDPWDGGYWISGKPGPYWDPLTAYKRLKDLGEVTWHK